MGLFANIANAQYSEGGNYIQPGVFKLKINEVKYKKSRTQKDLFFATFQVLESSKKADGTLVHEIGSEVTWMVNLANEPALGNIRQFVVTVAGDPNATVTEEDITKIIGDAQPFKNIEVRCSVTNIKTKRQTDYHRAKFFALNDETGAQEDNKAA